MHLTEAFHLLSVAAITVGGTPWVMVVSEVSLRFRAVVEIGATAVSSVEVSLVGAGVDIGAAEKGRK